MLKLAQHTWQETRGKESIQNTGLSNFIETVCKLLFIYFKENDILGVFL